MAVTREQIATEPAAPAAGNGGGHLKTAGLTLAALFALVTVDVVGVGHSLDLWLIHAVQRLDLPLMEPVFRFVDTLTASDGAIAMWIATFVVFVLLRWWVPAMIVLTLPIAGLINEAIGKAIGRGRPTVDEVRRVIGGTDAPAYPSGHVVGAVMLYGLMFLVADHIPNRITRLVVKSACVAIIGIVGLARMWYGAHWPSDVIGAYALGGLLLVILAALFRRAESAWSLPLVHADIPPHDESRPHAHALTSLVLFDGPTAAKVYAPGLIPRLIYALAFQASFAYIGNIHALRAAMYRRNLAALLTAYWYGAPRVARVIRIDRTLSGYAVVSEFVEGHAPADHAAAKEFLHDLCRRFEETGLPTWQIDPRQPRAVDNLLETADGRYCIVDLESGLVTPLASPRAWWRAVRRGLVPLYDDVFFDITRAYVAREQAAIQATLGEERYRQLMAALEVAAAETDAWHRSEPRVWSRLIRGLWTGFGIRTWPRRARTLVEDGGTKAQEWLEETIVAWQREGRITDAEAASVRAAMAADDFQALLPHFGAHLAITVVLRFPFGSIARTAWTIGALLIATAQLLLRRGSLTEWNRARRVHSPLVILLAPVPGFGTFAYFASGPVRSNRLLLRLTADATLQKIPWRLYERTALRRILARPAVTDRMAPVASGTGIDDTLHGHR